MRAYDCQDCGGAAFPEIHHHQQPWLPFRYSTVDYQNILSVSAGTMPGKHVDDGASEPCRRCKENTAVLVVRSEPLCRDCFTRYVHTKAVKRLESFRVRNAALDHQRKFLLALSFGVSSVTLLHVLDHLLQTQRGKTGRTGFAVDVVFVEVPGATVLKDGTLAEAQKAYPDFGYASLPLHDIFLQTSDPGLSSLVPNLIPEDSSSPSEKLTSLIASLTSATARADVISTLTTRLIVEHAKATGCEGILWGDSTTKLAEKTLSETAKGRGFSLPWRTSDGDSPLGLTFNYPLRDVLKKELVSAKQASMSSKNTTIDDLMRNYFEEVETNFPSIVSNVVRTTGKLETPSVPASKSRCDLCSMPVLDGRFGIHGWGGDQQDGSEVLSVQTGPKLCYGCTRSIPQNTTG
ncbi:hypothetical protein P280DRAFT_155468 [Massarina eburnea CBS 473.64]|uniref:Cytoplasmic tRNA 2-thiolation protein 2 n=1 Tax=Massarina eburnea CBS 473.64 TaxID=1395130 RepID=A0A6A6RMF1_9PLEO|nr:hypothetical protein P280DRAFT_155468 [Massarina eburnea CBS 473.64]